MKNKKIIFIAGVLAALGVVKLISASGDTEVEAIKLYNEDFVVSEVIQTTTTIVSTTTMPVFPTEVVDIDEVNIAIEDGEEFTVEELRYLYGKCGEFHDLALEVGWTEKEWPKLSQVMWKESRCTIDAWNGHDAGLTQINQIHTAWLLQMGYNHPDDMFDPRNNLYFAYRLWSGREENGQCGWKPWSIKCN
jgi:hypothetical protein